MYGVQNGTHSWELSLSLVMFALTPGNVRIELDSRALRCARGKKKKHIYLMSEMLSSTCLLLCTVAIVSFSMVFAALSLGKLMAQWLSFFKELLGLNNLSGSALRHLGPENSLYLNEVWQFT